MEEQFDSKLGREISIRILWQIFSKRFWVIVVAALVAVLSSFIVITATYTPLWESKAVLVTGVTGQKVESEGDNTKLKEMNTQTLQLALHLLEPCQYVVLSDKILDKVREQLPYVKSNAYLKNSIKVEAPIEDNGIFLEIIVKSDTPEHAQQIAEVVCDESVKEIRSDESMNYPAINKYYGAKLPLEPCNKHGFTTYLLIGVITAALVYLFFLLLYIFDDRIKSDDEIRESFGLSVLGDVPNENELAKRGSYYRKYGKYGSKYKRYVQYGLSESANQEMTKPEKKPERQSDNVSLHSVINREESRPERRSDYDSVRPVTDRKVTKPERKSEKQSDDFSARSFKEPTSKVHGKRRHDKMRRFNNNDNNTFQRPDDELLKVEKPNEKPLRSVNEEDLFANVESDGEEK